MARNEEGEFELVLGNKQLLSVFFILVVLLGVFFTMGYIVGRNNPSTEAVNLALARKPAEGVAGQPKEVDATGAQISEPRVIESPKAEPPKVAESKVEPPKPEPVKVEPPKPAAAKPEPVKPEPPKPEPPKKEAPKPAPQPPPATPGGVVAKPPSGSYLQVAAIDLKSANIMVDSLRKRSFPAVIMPGPADKPNIVRVLVGPMSSAEEVAKTRTRLEDIGMKGAMAKRL
jgi:cell division septation protein DedD